MKGILVLILAAAVGYAAYAFVYPPLAEAMKFEKRKKPGEIVITQESTDKPDTKVAPPRPEPKVEEVKPIETPKIAMPKMDAPKVNPNDFVPPPFDPIEVAVKNWTAIPRTAFPRQIKLKKDLSIQMKVGNGNATSQFKAGGQMVAMGQEGTSLLVAPTETSTMRGQVSIDDTDLKETLTAGYERWKVARVETLRKAHEFKIAAAEQAKNAPAAPVASTPAETAASTADKPKKGTDGTYPLLVASMKAGDVTEIKPDKVKEWGEPQIVDGAWTVIVKYETQTMFGKFDTEAQATIKNGKVAKWIYTGSGEVVP